jgi:hypothetical protein
VLSEEAVGELARAGSFFAHEYRLPRDTLERDAAVAGERMIRSCVDEEGIRRYALHDDFGFSGRVAEYVKVVDIVREPVDDLPPRADMQGDVEAGVFLDEGREQARRDVLARAGDGKAQRACGEAPQVGQTALHAGERLEQLGAGAIKLLSRGGHVDPLAHLLEQREAYRGGELLYLYRDSGLRDVKLFCGARVAAETGHSFEHSQLGKSAMAQIAPDFVVGHAVLAINLCISACEALCAVRRRANLKRKTA